MSGFSLLPTIDLMLDLYSRPRNLDRFQEYLQILQGNTKGDLKVPIGNFNPMAKEHASECLEELKNLRAESIIAEVAKELSLIHPSVGIDFKIALNLADDLQGGWTNRFTTDYDSRFRIGPLVDRRFCTPLFWTSEKFSEELIYRRVRAACVRSLYWVEKPKPVSLLDHILQEAAVARDLKLVPIPSGESNALIDYFQLHKHSGDYSCIFNFLYGSKASESLGFPVYGILSENAGLNFAVGFQD